ncbi:hypothetical protein ASG36_19540 [Geodermatophilus sp. Leaf369]|nr:hypothetical protein ASG36_19540 [Geodermatophilus sp. Leaf369]
MHVRPRAGADLPGLLAILQRSHELHAYPVRASVVRADWLALPTELMGAVAEHEGRVVGHVALHPADGPGHDAGEQLAAQRWAAATGVPVSQLAVVSRLVTEGSVRGAGSALLAHAVRVAGDLGRVPVLLVEPEADARGFYRRRGWREIGTARQQWGEHTVDAVLMVVGEQAD